MIIIHRTNSENQDFIELVKQLDKELASRDGELHSFYDHYNKITGIKNVVVAYRGNIAAGCGAIKQFEEGVFEVKRMFVKLDFRNQGIASFILTELEKWCLDLGNEKLVLETGIGQPEAIRFYKKHGFKSIPNFGQYAEIQNSVCFEKYLNS
ncbi:MAG TPA: GNAT family N-acetyltransferase [Bacteroidales bacterium]|nr:GNAT family N-acetyltransferase [Bacteroidales bacterium]HRX98376.1 GNAT family N-acetyltransferase [Bacteroidales bacterium]